MNLINNALALLLDRYEVLSLAAHYVLYRIDESVCPVDIHLFR